MRWETGPRGLLESLHGVDEVQRGIGVLLFEGRGIDSPAPVFLDAALALGAGRRWLLRLRRAGYFPPAPAPRPALVDQRVMRMNGKIEFRGSRLPLIIIIAHASGSRVRQVERARPLQSVVGLD